MQGNDKKTKTSHKPTFYHHPPGYRLRRGRNWFMLGLTYASYYLCRYNLGIVAPELKATLGFSNAQYGAIQSARNMAYGVGQLLNGLFTDGIGGKQAMTIGAIGTVVLNLLFGIVAWSNIGYLFATLFFVRLLDGYVQAFGAPGFIKINTSWFRREERGTFAGIFGIMINLGKTGVGQLAGLLATGFSIPLIFYTITVPTLDWRYMFIVPPAIVVIVIILMNLMVQNHPEEAGHSIVHDDEEDAGDPSERLTLGTVFRKISGNPIVWIVAGAYFCTGFVRAAIYDWWAIYLKDVWSVGKTDAIFWWLAVILFPCLASAGSLGSGFISDKFFHGRRAPVAAALYFTQGIFVVLSMMLAERLLPGSAVVAVVLLLCIDTACNATHSILGSAAAMDIGGRKMAGFASGVIDSFQYFGATIAGFGLGKLLDAYKVAASSSAVQATTNTAVAEVSSAAEFAADTAGNAASTVGTAANPMVINPTVWFASMLPWTILGTCLMVYIWRKHGTSGRAGT